MDLPYREYLCIPSFLRLEWRENDRKLTFVLPLKNCGFVAPEPLWGLITNFAVNLLGELGLDGTRYGVLTNPFGCGLIADWLEEHTNQLQPTPEPELLQAICTELRRGLQPAG